MDEKSAIKILQKRREGDKARFKRWQQKQIDAGKKHLTCMISGEAYDILTNERQRTKATISEVIETALKGQFSTSTMDLILDDPGEDEIPQSDIKPDWKTQKDEYKLYLDNILENDIYQGQWKEQADKLNQMNIKTSKGLPWTNNNLRMACNKFKKK